MDSLPRAALARRLGAVLALGLAAGVTASQDASVGQPIEEHAEVRLLTLRLRIRPTWSVTPGACMALEASDLDVRLRGEPVDPARVELDRRRERTLHALLIDTSDSMSGSMDQVRRAAASYVEQLDPLRDRAMIVTFDDSVLLHQAATADRERLLAAIAGIQPAQATSLHDALYYTVQELSTYRERAVIVLLTDGYDTASLHEREDVMERVAAHPDLMIFPIGFNLPELAGSGPAGYGSIRHFLQRLAHRTNGGYIVAPTGSRLDAAYRRIREMLDSEAVLRVEDPDPHAEPGQLRVSSRKSGCRVDVLSPGEPAEDPSLRALERPFPELPYDFDVPPDPRLHAPRHRAFRTVDPACAVGDPRAVRDDPWRASASEERIRGCALDVATDLGSLYDPLAIAGELANPVRFVAWNGAIETRARPFEVDLPELAALPERPEALCDRLAAQALQGIELESEAGSGRRKASHLQARPYVDLPALVNGRTFFDLRAGLATALFAHPDYRGFALGVLHREAERDLEDLRERYRRRVPGAEASAIETAALESEAGRRILARADRPSPADLTRLLAAWLGDVPAQELLERWESSRLDELLAGRSGAETAGRFAEAWAALRSVLFVPTYAREITLLVPVHDRLQDRIGYYRIVLPRVGWMVSRLQNFERHADLPLDLLPEQPLAYRAMEQILEARPELAAHLAHGDYRVRSLVYESRLPPRKRTPRLAFREARATLVIDGREGATTLELDLAQTRTTGAAVEIAGVRASSEGDPILASLTQPLETEYARPLAAAAGSRAAGARRP